MIKRNSCKIFSFILILFANLSYSSELTIDDVDASQLPLTVLIIKDLSFYNKRCAAFYNAYAANARELGSSEQTTKVVQLFILAALPYSDAAVELDMMLSGNKDMIKQTHITMPKITAMVPFLKEAISTEAYQQDEAACNLIKQRTKAVLKLD